jgi:hypothetical protein
MDFFQLSDNLGEQRGKYWVSPYYEGHRCAVAGPDFLVFPRKAATCKHAGSGFRAFPLDSEPTSTDTSEITPPPLSPLVGDAHHGEVFLCAALSPGLTIHCLHLSPNSFGDVQ